MTHFSLPKGLVGRFAIVKLWPGINNAETECMARLKITAKKLGLECIEINASGHLITDTTKVISPKDVDFVIHLHYETPKIYDAFSFVALWNPTAFYHEWNYSRCTRNLLTHDDFLSCSSPAADDHINRLIQKDCTHLSPHFNLYHSLVEIINQPSLGDYKLFYAGINWEALGDQKKSRHSGLLKCLDKTGHLRIYGPSVFLGVKVWAGYESYVKEIPFDGVSMITEISNAGIALVLSSEAHKDSELMSNRLFEGIAAGALIICDENNFAQKFFGDSLLYIDTRQTTEHTFNEILKQIDWAKKNPKNALQMIAKSQKIFQEKFSQTKNLSELYLGFTERKKELLAYQQQNDKKINISLNLLLPEYTKKLLDQQINNALSQTHTYFSPKLVVDKNISQKNFLTIEKKINALPIKFELIKVNFYAYDSKAKKIRNNFGKIISELLKNFSSADAIIFIAPNEQIFSNHLQALANALTRNSNVNCAATATILKKASESTTQTYTIEEQIDFASFNPQKPIGYGRFIFRVSELPHDLNLTLPYLDRKALGALIGNSKIHQEISSTMIIDIENEFFKPLLSETHENAVIHDIYPNVFEKHTGYQILVPQPLFNTIELPSNSILNISTLKKLLKILCHFISIQIIALCKEGPQKRFKALQKKINDKLAVLKPLPKNY